MPKQNRSKKLIVANWKMNPEDSARAKEIFLGIRRTARELNRVKTIICPPFPYLYTLNELFFRERMALGAQNMFYENEGAYTGEISASILKNVGVTYVLAGHSERRAMGETNEVVNKKVLKAIKAGLNVILCVGERDRDHSGEYLDFIKTQLKESLSRVQRKDLGKLVVAYEPVWAIGRSDKDAMKPADIHEMSIYIKRVLSDMFGQDAATPVPVLYGGSVTSRISEPIFRDGKIDGLLVGRASLDPKDFSLILKQANEL